ncbi:MAG TPA: L-lactate dehydrogenase [Kiritimatiellia bacterium]|nr:L-lactate dehydrogenase [Kiritimatiellia bacterium]HRU70342.1 L-lactate dehydrogenase [Kiritimatiellia bacterium]
MNVTKRKVVVVGAGDVGASFAYALAQSGLSEEIALIDRNEDLARGQALDLAHGQPFLSPVHIHAGNAEDYADAAVIVVTAGAKQQPGESRLNLLGRNAAIVSGIMDAIVASGSHAAVVIVTNPVDILTHVALRRSGLPSQRVFGSGTVLDSARFRYLLSRHCEVDVRNVHAYILGEHGDSEVAAWSMTHVAGMPIVDYCAVCGRCDGWRQAKEEIVRQVRDSAYHIIGYKGSTCYGVGMALVRIVGAVLRNERSVLTVSSLMDGAYDIDDVCLSVPCIVGAGGVEQVVRGRLADDEAAALQHSAKLLKQTLAALDASATDTAARS